ncbi:MAG: DUF368 domain-containing protein [Planctomycetota bacterium]|nr:DUF368 domain-containing protein [Planctomycetota bacterium]
MAARTDAPPRTPPDAPPGRVFAAGFLMGLANLVPGVSGGTMILALGLYDRFIGAVAELTSLRWSRPLIAFLAVLAVGLGLALVGLAAPAVYLVREHRWLMYALFIGLTLGGVPELVRHCRPLRVRVGVWALIGLGGMVALTVGLRTTAVPQNMLSLFLIGALAAASMILPGVSGSYILLIFGMYEVVVGSLRLSALRDDLGASLAILLPFAIGAVLGIGLLSNALRFLLARFVGPSHGFLLGLLVGAVVGLWPFQRSEHPDLAVKHERKAVLALVQGEELAAVNERFDLELDESRAAVLRAKYAGSSGDDLERMRLELETFRPSIGQVAIVLLVLGAGFGLTRTLGTRAPMEPEA